MQWMTAQEAAAKWNISLRYVQRLLSEGRVPNAKKYGNAWMIPLEEEKPSECNLKELSAEKGLPYLVCIWDYPLAENFLEDIFKNEGRSEFHAQYIAEVAYMRGDFLQSKHFAYLAYRKKPYHICAALILMISAISLNDFSIYYEVEESLKKQIMNAEDKQDAILAEIVLAAVAVSMFAPNLVADWIKEGDLSELPEEAIAYALYIKVKYLQNIQDFHRMLAVCETIISMRRTMHSVMDIYLLLMCAAAQVGLGCREKARKYVLEALALGMPHGFITPFAENVITLGGLLEECVQEHYNYAYRRLLEQWQESWKNWAVFHNQFTQDKVSLILNRREMRIATMAASRIPYVDIAREEDISVGRVRNIMQNIYSKLMISNREDLSSMVLWRSKKT